MRLIKWYQMVAGMVFTFLLLFSHVDVNGVVYKFNLHIGLIISWYHSLIPDWGGGRASSLPFSRGYAGRSLAELDDAKSFLYPFLWRRRTIPPPSFLTLAVEGNPDACSQVSVLRRGWPKCFHTISSISDIQDKVAGEVDSLFIPLFLVRLESSFLHSMFGHAEPQFPSWLVLAHATCGHI